MENQYRDGNSYQQISDYLNSNGFRKKLTNGLYSRRDVSMSLLKYRRRLSRNTQSTVLNLVESLVLIPLKISQNHNLNWWSYTHFKVLILWDISIQLVIKFIHIFYKPSLYRRSGSVETTLTYVWPILKSLFV